jgi:hypothetical protein
MPIAIYAIRLLALQGILFGVTCARIKMESERDESKVSKESTWKGEKRTLDLSQLSTSVIPVKTHSTYPISLYSAGSARACCPAPFPCGAGTFLRVSHSKERNSMMIRTTQPTTDFFPQYKTRPSFGPAPYSPAGRNPGIPFPAQGSAFQLVTLSGENTDSFSRSA